MELTELKTNIRKTVGNGPARALRRKGQIPAVLYGPGKETVSLSVDTNSLKQILKKQKISQVLLNLVIKNGKTSTRTVMIKEMQTDPVSRDYLHIDFYEVAMDRKIRASVPVVTKGISKGVELGGIVQVVRRELEVLCLPLNIPKAFEIDITDLDIGDSVHVEEIPLDEGVEIPTEVNFTVLTVVTPKVEAEAEEEEVEGEEIEEEGEAEEGDEAEE